MGHAPFEYPTPDGYPDEEVPWLGTLLWRWRFASALAANAVAGTRIDERQLLERSGSREALTAHCLGRRPTPNEVAGLAPEAVTVTATVKFEPELVSRVETSLIPQERR